MNCSYVRTAPEVIVPRTSGAVCVPPAGARDGTAYQRRLLEGAIADSATPRPHLEFYRFESTIEREANIVVLEDVFDATEASVQRVPLTEFVDALRHCSA